MAYRLRVVGPDEKALDVSLRPGETHVGRAPECDVVLDGRGVSRKHAVITLDGSHVGIHDLGSRYGTQVNGQPVTAGTLRAGDWIGIGVYRVELVVTGVDRRTTPGQAPPPVSFTSEEPSPQAVHAVFPRRNSDMLGVVQRLAKEMDAPRPDAPQIPQVADYRALLMIARVSDALARSRDLGEFLEMVADLCADELRAETVVILSGQDVGELAPTTVRYHGELRPGEIPVSRTLLARAIGERATVVLTDADVGPASKIASVALYKVRAAATTPLIASDRTLGAIYLARTSAPFDRQAADMLTALSTLVASGLERADLRDRLRREEEQRKALERFHPAEVAAEVVHTVRPGESALEERRATALAADVWGYVTLAGRLAPRALAAFLGDYYDMLYDAVFSNGGTLVKVWDGRALAVFGVPRPAAGDAERACAAALALRDAFKPLKDARAPKERVELRVAVDTGDVLAGPIGAPERLEYTALGDPVATSLDLAARGPEGTVLATERTLNDAGLERYRVRTVERAYGAGEINVYELVEKKS